MSYISKLPTMQDPMKANRKRPAVHPHATGQKDVRMSGCPTDATFCKFLHTISVLQERI